MKLIVQEHKSSSYAPRTYHNASVADLTIAIASDLNTAGERLTKKAAGSKYLAIHLNDVGAVDAGRQIWKYLHAMYGTASSVINVAGNGIYTLDKYGFTQDQINQYLYDALLPVSRHLHITQIVSGGQTGVDLAGGVAGVALGIPVVLTLPKGFRQRHEDGVDVDHTMEEVIMQVRSGVDRLVR